MATAPFAIPFGTPQFGQWVVGVDRGRKLYLFQEGATTPSGGAASYKGLTHWFSLPEIRGGRNSAALSRALGSLQKQTGITGVQTSGILQSVDSGAIEQGNNFVAQPFGQRPGQTMPGQGQRPSSSEATPSNVLPDPGISSAIADTITGTVDFLKLAAWLVHPRNLLRAVEFLVGIALMIFGVWAAYKAHSGGHAAPDQSTQDAREVIGLEGLNRVSRALASKAVVE